MPKFYKQNILTDLATGKPNVTPEELIKQHTIEVQAPVSEGNPIIQHASESESESESESAEGHPHLFSPHQTHIEHSPVVESKEINFHMPQDEDHLLQSPLDTPELPEHAGNATPASEENTYSNPGPVFKPQPVSDPVTSPSQPYIMPTQTNMNGFPLPETKVVETLMTWRAPSRPHRKKNRSFYTTVAILIILIAMISLLAGERMLVAVLFALMFLVYVLNFIEPGEIEYKISTQGVTIDEHFYHWQELDSFWFEKKDGYSVLHIYTQLKFPTMLMMVLGLTTQEDEVKKTVARFLPFHEIAPKSVVEKWAEGLQKYFPLENPHK